MTLEDTSAAAAEEQPEAGEPLAESARPRVSPSALRAALGVAREDAAAETADDGTGAASVAAEHVTGEPHDVADAASDGGDGAAPPEGGDDAAPPAADEPADAHLGEEDAAFWAGVPLPIRLEALLFAAPAPLPLRRLAHLSGAADVAAVRAALAELGASYAAGGRAFEVDEIAGGVQLRTRPEFSGVLARLGRRPSTEKLSPAAIETLAIVAYRQPVLRTDVEKIRGVASGEVLRTLIERGLVRVAGRADLPGSPLLYGTTAAFLEHFGLRDLKDLPSDREMLRRPV